MKRYWPFALLSLCMAAPAHAQAEMPEKFLQNIYEQYLGHHPGVKLNNEAALRRFFTPETARLIMADRKAAHGQAPKLDGDPFVDAQEWNIDKIHIGVDIHGHHATAAVHFDNFGQERNVTLELVMETPTAHIKGKHVPTGQEYWRVDDIQWSDGSLRQLIQPATKTSSN